MLRRLFGRKSGEDVAERLYAAAVAQARRPYFYAQLGVEDRIDARFELYTLHVLLLVLRLRDEGEMGVEPAQAVFDTYVSALDHVLRELGVGDVSMGKKMRALGQALYGRMTAYETPLRASDQAGLSAALARNVMGADAAIPASEALAAYAVKARTTLAEQSVDVLMRSGQPSWPELEGAA